MNTPHTPPRDAADSVLRTRGRAASLVLFAIIGILIAAFFRLQVLRSSGFALRSVENRLRAIPIPAPRGGIYDRNGRLVAENIPGYSISILPGKVDSVRATLDRMAPYLGLSEQEREALLTKFRRFRHLPLPVKDNVGFEQVAAIEERRPEFRRAVIEMQPRRYYPAGRAIAHVIGYVSEISEAELERPEFEGYEAGRVIGKAGIERQYQHVLGGTPGVSYVEVNARGSIVSEFGPRPNVSPVPGQDIVLGLDLSLQEYVDSIFPEGERGGVVALDPRTGEVLVLYSHPTFDPNEFVGGISARLWNTLRSDPDQPLLNRVSYAAYAAGSTWKLVISTLGLRNGVFTIDSHMPTSCRGALQYGTRAFRCWKREGHGSLDLSEAIKQSCNVFFYQAGLRLGLDALTAGADALGFNRKSGLDLPVERAGFYPPGREWYDRRYGRRGWTESVVLNLSIGQGETQQTLIKMAQFYTALATGESPIVPHLLRNEAMEGRRVEWSLELPEERRLELVQALTRVVNEPGGTAYRHRLNDVLLAGKTGTAQNPHGPPHSWFLGFAPAYDPRIVVAAIVEYGHPDNQAALAVPVATRLAARYLGVTRPADAVATTPILPDTAPPVARPAEPIALRALPPPPSPRAFPSPAAGPEALAEEAAR
ncbi:MAG: penicillin-binding protein 2 [Gemmatimonadota bacterium]